jgi:hypothetical protein
LFCYCLKTALVIGLIHNIDYKRVRLHPSEVKNVVKSSQMVPTKYAKRGIVYDKTVKNIYLEPGGYQVVQQKF